MPPSILKVTEDAKKGQNYIVVEDASNCASAPALPRAIKIFTRNIGNVLMITNIAGNKVFFHLGRYREYGTLQWTWPWSAAPA